MTVREHDRFLTSRVEGKASRVQVPLPRRACESCRRTVAGLTSPWGTTEVCGMAKCQLFAQRKDMPVKPAQLALLPGKPLEIAHNQWYCGLVVAYQGDGKWALGAVRDDNNREAEWFKGISFIDMMKLINDYSSRIKRKDDEEIFGYVEG